MCHMSELLGVRIMIPGPASGYLMGPTRDEYLDIRANAENMEPQPAMEFETFGGPKSPEITPVN